MLESCQLLASAWFFRARSGPEPGNGTDSEKSVPMLFFSYPMVNSPPRSSALLLETAPMTVKETNHPANIRLGLTRPDGIQIPRLTSHQLRLANSCKQPVHYGRHINSDATRAFINQSQELVYAHRIIVAPMDNRTLFHGWRGQPIQQSVGHIPTRKNCQIDIRQDLVVTPKHLFILHYYNTACKRPTSIGSKLNSATAGLQGKFAYRNEDLSVGRKKDNTRFRRAVRTHLVRNHAERPSRQPTLPRPVLGQLSRRDRRPVLAVGGPQ